MDQEILKKIERFPKIELHRHLEGSVSTPLIIKIAEKHKLKLPTFNEEELNKHVKLYSPMNNLPDVLKMFEIAQSVFVSLEAIEEITIKALENAYEKENIKLLELRFSPDFMLRGKNLDWQEVLGLMLDTMKKFEKTKGDFVSGLIIIASRAYGIESVKKSIDFAIENKKKIIGFDFADDEINYAPKQYIELTKKLHEQKIPLTVHTGEEGSFELMRDTLKFLKPRRVGHGVKAIYDPSGETLRLLKENEVHIESNPWSNYLTHAVGNLSLHPLKRFIREGLSVSISADDPEVLNTDLNHEYRVCIEKMGLSFENLEYCNKCALKRSFIYQRDRSTRPYAKMLRYRLSNSG